MAMYEDGPGESGEIATDGGRRPDAARAAVPLGSDTGSRPDTRSRPDEGSRPGGGSRPDEGSRPGADGGVQRPPADGRAPASPPGEASVLSRGYRALTLGIVSVVFLIAFEATAVGTAMPVAADELDGVSAYAFAFSALFTTALLGMVVSGLWCDRRGPLPPVATGIGAFVAGLVLSGTAVTMWIFVLGRAVQGIGGGLVVVALYVTVSRAYPERLRPPVMSAFAAAWVVPAVVGPLIAGSVTQHMGWRWVFLGIPLLVAVPLAVMMPALRRSASGPPPGADVPGQEPGSGTRPGKGAGNGTGGGAGTGTGTGAGERGRLNYAGALAVGAGLLQYAGQELSLPAVVPALAGTALLVPAALRLLPRGTYRAARGLPAVVLLRGIAAGGFVVAESFVPLMLVSQRGLSVTLAGLALAAGGATWALGSFTQSRARLGPHRERLAQGGMVLVTGGVAYAPVVLLETVPVWTLAVAMAVACYGMGLVIGATSVLLLQLSAPETVGKNSAALQMSDSLSNVVLLAATGAAFAACGGGSVSVGVHGAEPAGAAAGGQPLAFLAVYAVSAVVCAVGVGVAGRLRGPA
ncbi:Major Facilitator Superfamily protein [Streptomyces sp. WMMB 714]|uniref:MFS transporter n=1 Tax=Streptomyces sp. WMMB 714 TaxID=1286822 RepID=UPI000823A724|nr:MFS transporter [Streptomyces sp. WMMB 714]SCK56583.1 Major Facilitator Superfamily protein [Streptomyces sp. WMMB 714]